MEPFTLTLIVVLHIVLIHRKFMIINGSSARFDLNHSLFTISELIQILMSITGFFKEFFKFKKNSVETM